MVAIDFTALLTREGHSFQCHLCRRSCGASSSTIKRHYSDEHHHSVSVSSKISESVLSELVASSGQQRPLPSLSNSDVDMEDVNTPLPLDAAPFAIGAEEGPADPETDDDGEWEEVSSLSDTDTEVGLEEDEDAIVPASFTLSSNARPPPGNDPSAVDEMVCDTTSQAKEEDASSLKAVYGSESEGFFPPSVHNHLLTWNITELTHRKPLCKVGYTLNEGVKVVICVGCHRGVPVDNLNSHSKNNHPGRTVLSSSEAAAVVDELTKMGYRTSLVEAYHQLPGQKPVDGLEVLEGFLCRLPNNDGSECRKVFEKQSTFVRHLSDHTGLPRGSKPNPSLCTSYVQTLFRQGGLRHYFSVDPSLSKLDPSAASAYAHAVQLQESLPKAQIPVSDHDKDQASIHWFTRWPELLKLYISDSANVAYLRSLVSFPDPASDPEWLTRLQDHGSWWWKKAEAAHISCSFCASIMLKCHDRWVFPPLISHLNRSPAIV